jgi:Protein of unknown function (DUF2950)
MRRTKTGIDVHGGNFLKMAAVAFILLACFPAVSKAQQKDQKTFASAEEASNAIVTAMKNNDEAAMLAILGPDGKEIVSSGDPKEDADHRKDFTMRYDQMHRLVKEPNGTTLYIGAENWPCPIPIVNKGGAWYFDTAAGKQEILYRRVGRNEMSAIRVCQELVAAENEYFTQNKSEYAQKFLSDEGQQNGLYWKSTDSKSESPIGPLVASAALPNSPAKNLHTPPAPFHGYYFRILTRQGKHAPSGASDYVVAGKMTGGFAFVAFPAEYRNSGVMTFIVGKDGAVYEKDLGSRTESAAKSLKAYDPDSSWHKLEKMEEEAASAQKSE